MRHIDRVIVKGTTQPLDLFTFDVNLGQFQVILPSLAKLKKMENSKQTKITRYLSR